MQSKPVVILLLVAVLAVSADAVFADSITPNSPGWVLVRRVSHNYGGWHPTTDNLAGTHTYGTATTNPTADATFSVNFESTVSGYDQILLSTGDGVKWMVFDKSKLAIPRADEDIEVLSSHLNSTPYNVQIFNRSNFPEDPWLSSRDHFYGGADQHDDSDAHSMLYGEAGYSFWAEWRNNRLGANVFIRDSSSVIPLPSAAGLGLVMLGGLGLLRRHRRRKAA